VGKSRREWDKLRRSWKECEEMKVYNLSTKRTDRYGKDGEGMKNMGKEYYFS